MFKNKKVFVSGGNGVIGNELVRLLHKEGAIVLVGDLKPRPLDWPKEIIYRQGDLNYITKDELDDFGPEIFFHLAATFERSTETYGFWEENFQHNVNLSHHLMTLLKDSPTLKKVIFASSYLIYNKELYNFDKPKSPYSLKETDPISPRNLTGCAKLSHEIELNFLKEFKKNDLQVINARIYRSYGRNSRDIISRWVRALMNKEEISVFNKENVFDYIFAGDVAEGLFRLADTDYDGIVNLGTGKSRSIEEVVSVLKQFFPDMKAKEEGQMIKYESSQADTSLLKKITKWTPAHRLEDAIPKIIEFEKTVGFNDKKTNVNVLVTSAAKKIGLVMAVRKAMDKLGGSGKLFAGDMDSNSISKHFVDEFWTMPRTDSDNVKSIIDYLVKNDIRVVIPSRDGELGFWAKNKAELKKRGITVMISDPITIENCVDKLKFYQECEKLGLPAIATWDKLEDDKVKRYVVKERFGAGSRSIGLNLTKDDAEKHAKTLEQPIFQPYVEGQEYSVDLFVSSKGEVKGLITRERNVVVNGESQITTTVSNKKIEKASLEFAEKFGLYGHNILQLLLDKNGKVAIIECNSRFGGASTVSQFAGLDSFYWLLLESLGEDISDYPFIRSTGELMQVRYADNKIIRV